MGYSDNVVFLGTELKLSINIGGSEKDSPIPNMGDFSFKVEVFCNPKKTLITKYKATNGSNIEDTATNGIDIIYSYDPKTDKIDPTSFILLINTELLGTGSVKCKVTAYLPDDDFEPKDDNNVSTVDIDGFRTEVSIVDTGITIEKSI